MTHYRICFAIALMLACRSSFGQDAATQTASAPTGPSRVIIIETNPEADASKVIDMVVEALEKNVAIKTQPAADLMMEMGTEDEIEIELHLRRDAPTEQVIQIVKDLSNVDFQPLRVKFAPKEASENLVRIKAGRDVQAASVQRIIEYFQRSKISTNFSLSAASAALSIESLRAMHQQLEQKTRELAGELQRTKGDSNKRAEQRAQLRDAVSKAFQAHQKVRRAELAEFARRVQRIEASLESRDQIEAQIVDRRVTELLHPDSKWEVETFRADPNARPRNDPNASNSNPFSRNNPSDFEPDPVLRNNPNRTQLDPFAMDNTNHAKYANPFVGRLKQNPSSGRVPSEPEARLSEMRPATSPDNAFKERLELMEKEFRAGRSRNVMNLIDAIGAYYEQQLDQNPTDGMRILEQFRDRLTQYQEVASLGFQHGTISRQDVLAFDVALLRIEKQIVEARRSPLNDLVVPPETPENQSP